MGRVRQSPSSALTAEPESEPEPEVEAVPVPVRVGFTEEGERTRVPNALTMCLCARVPGSTTCRAMRSASMMGMSWEANSAETVDFPVAIPPVRPTTASWRK